MLKYSLIIGAFLSAQLSAFSTTNVQYLYGGFEGETFLDTRSGAKHTVTAEHYRTFAYGDLFTFADYTYAPGKMRFSGKEELYGEFSPRLSLNKITGTGVSKGVVKEWYAAFQHNRSETYRAWLYGAGVDLNLPGFSIFGLNLYRKIQNIGRDTYQLSANYYAPLGEKWHFEGFTDWTEYDLLTQNQLLFNLSPTLNVTSGKAEAGTEWHYYRDTLYNTDNSVFQAMVKYIF